MARDALLRSARELLVERGARHVSIREIAGRAGVNLSQIYYYFGSKDALRAEVLLEAMTEFDPTRAGQAGRPGGSDAGILSIMEATHARLSAVPIMPRLMIRELARNGPGMRRIADRVILPRLRRLEALILAGHRAGTIRRGPARVQAAACAALVLYWHLFQPILTEFGVDVLSPSVRRAIVRETAAILEDGLFVGTATAGVARAERRTGRARRNNPRRRNR